jgi:hypothetical protein
MRKIMEELGEESGDGGSKATAPDFGGISEGKHMTPIP